MTCEYLCVDPGKNNHLDTKSVVFFVSVGNFSCLVISSILTK